MKVLITGTAGFIGFHLATILLKEGVSVVGVDCVTDYYDVSLKEERLNQLKKFGMYTEYRQDISEPDAVAQIFQAEKPTHCVNLAAQAGVRHSMKDPWAYTKSNVDGFLSILEACRHFPVQHLIFASTSSVYGANQKMPFTESENAEHPMTLYAATKKANELMAHNYAHLFGVPSTGVRFFTVYGPWGRPDMALFLFTKAILEGRPIDVFNQGKMKRDFTYVGDIVRALNHLLSKPPAFDAEWDSFAPRPDTSGVAPYRILNIGNSKCEELESYISALEKSLGRKAERNYLPMQEGDVPATWANTSALKSITGYAPQTTIEEGIQEFVDWYLDFYGVSDSTTLNT